MFTLKTFLLIVYSITCSATTEETWNPTISSREEIGRMVDGYYETDTHYLDDHGNLIKTNTLSVLHETLEETERDLPNRVSFYLYTRKNPKEPQQLFVDDVQALNNSYFDMNKETKIVAHGWRIDHNNQFFTPIQEALLKNSDCNVVIVDWSKIAKNAYYWAVHRILMVGKYAADFLSFLESLGLDENKLTTIGHSLGSHIAGLTSYYATRKAAYVFGLDPGPPSLILIHPEANFSPHHGKYVQVIHTSSGCLGQSANLGDVDFWPSGGVKQPSCKQDDDGCSHFVAFIYYVESLVTKVGFIGVQCPNYDDYLQGKCVNNSRGIMGGSKPELGLKGSYYLMTNKYSPYARGYK